MAGAGAGLNNFYETQPASDGKAAAWGGKGLRRGRQASGGGCKSLEQRLGARAGGGRRWHLLAEETELLPEQAVRWQRRKRQISVPLREWGSSGTNTGS